MFHKQFAWICIRRNEKATENKLFRRQQHIDRCYTHNSYFCFSLSLFVFVVIAYKLCLTFFCSFFIHSYCVWWQQISLSLVSVEEFPREKQNIFVNVCVCLHLSRDIALIIHTGQNVYDLIVHLKKKK